MGNYMGHTSGGPTKDIYNIPNEVLQEAIDVCVSYGDCPHCGTNQFYVTVPGHNSSHTCIDCGKSVAVVG